MRIDIQMYRENTCIYCEKHSKTLEFGKCPATKEDIHKCARRKMFMYNMKIEETTYKIASKYKYVGEMEVVRPGDIFKKNSTPRYDEIEGTEITLDDLGKLYIAVDKMLYDFSNQWEDGMNPYDFLEGVIKAMKGEE